MSRKKIEVSQSAVEFALVLPLLLMIIFGMIEMGHLIFVYGSVLNATREAARYGAVTGNVTVAGYANPVPQYMDCTGIKNKALNLKFLATFTASDIQVMYDTGPGDLNPEGPCSTSLNYSGYEDGNHRIAVTITDHYTFLLPLIPIQAFDIVSTSRRSILGSVSISGTVVAPPAGSPPTISSITPNSGPTTGGTPVKITGTNLSGGTVTVLFGGSLGNCSVDFSTQISCTTPAHAAGTVDVIVSTSSGTFTLTNAFTFIQPTPTFTSTPTPTDTATPTVTFTPLYTPTQTSTPTPTFTRTVTPTVTKTPTKTLTPTVTNTAVCSLVYNTPPVSYKLPTATPVTNPTTAASANILLFYRTVYNTNPDPIQVASITVTYLDKTGEAPLYRILETTIYPSNGGSASDIITATSRTMYYTNFFIPAGGSATFYVYYQDTNIDSGGNKIKTQPGDLTGVSISILNVNPCTK